MIKFTNTASNPKAMVVILLHTSIAIIAVLAPVWKFFYSAYFAFSILWNLKFPNMPKTRLILHFLFNIIFNI